MSAEGRFALKPGLVHVAVADGTYFELGARSFLVRNAKLYPVIDRIIGALARGIAPVDVRRALPAAVHRLFDELITQLRHNSMVTTGPPPSLAAEDGPFRETLLYLQEVTSDAWAAYTAWTQSPIALSGREAVADEVAVHLARSGATNLILLGDTQSGRAERLRNRLAGDLDPAELDVHCAAAETEPASVGETSPLLVHLAELGESDTSRARHEALARGYEDVVFGGIGPAVALVGPPAKAGLGDGPALLALAPSGPALSPRAAAAAAALIAFEALRIRTAPWTDDQAAIGRSANRFLLLGDDIRPRSHDARLALASKRLPLAQDTVPDWLPDALVAETQPLFDDGVLAWAEVHGPEYPLAHRAIMIAAAAGDRTEEHLVAWGSDFAAAEARVMAQAVAFLAERLGARDHPEEGWGPFVAHADDAWVRSVARAYVLAPQVAPVAVCPDSLVDAELRMLLRLARLYHAALPELWVARLPERAGIAWARLGAHSCAAAGASLEDALTEAVGDLLSYLQCGAPPSRQKLPSIVLLTSRAISGGSAIPIGEVRAGTMMAEIELDIRETFRPFAFTLARARLSK